MMKQDVAFGRSCPPGQFSGRGCARVDSTLKLSARHFRQKAAGGLFLCRSDVGTALGDSNQGGLIAGQKGKVDDGYRAASEYLRLLGLNNTAEIGRILDIAMNPNSLFSASRDEKRRNALARLLDVEKDLKPVVAFLEGKGLTRDEVLRVIKEHPPVLCYDVEARLAPFFDYLASLGIKDPGRLLVQRPSLIGLEADKNLRRVVGYLQETGHTLEQIQNLLATSI